MSRILVVGGGFGGIVAANELRRLLPSRHKITLIEKSQTFHIGATKPWVMLGQKSPEDVCRPVDRLKRRKIEVLRRTVKNIDAHAAKVSTDKGDVRGDFMIIALGADYDMAAISGLRESAETFYTLEGAARLRDKLKTFTGGEVVVLVPRGPFKCPPAPYEAAMLLHAHFRKNGILDKTKLSLFTFEGAPMATAGPETGKFMRGMLEERGIAYHPLKRTKSVDSGRKTISFEDGTETRFDLLIAVPPHIAPAAVKESGLIGEQGWVPADPKTLQLAGTGDAGRIYVVGDVSVVYLPGRIKPDVPLVMPKAGTIADAEACIAAAHIAARINNRAPDSAFDGNGFCFIETGDRHAVRGDGSFFSMPTPTMRLAAPDMMQYDDKTRWIDDWMRRNLGD